MRTQQQKQQKKKIDSIRSGFRKEMKKLKASKTSGSGTGEIYTPRLWYYQYLTFLTDQETPRGSVSNIELESEDEQNDTNDVYDSQLSRMVCSTSFLYLFFLFCEFELLFFAMKSQFSFYFK